MRCRRIATRYDNLAANYLAFIKLASIRLWLRRHQLAAFQTGRVTLEEHLGQLNRLREQALDSKQVSAAVRAEAARGRAAGLYEHRLRLTVSTSDAALINALEAVLGKETAAAIGAASGMPARRAS